MRSPSITAGVALLAATGIVAISASCNSSADPIRPATAVSHVHVATRHAASAEPDLKRKLAELRRSTNRYHNFEAAQADGYTFEVTKCMEDATRGGMGYHYAKPDLIDGTVIEARPEVLLYEPRGKRLHLVGVEFIIPFTEWTGAEPPVLYGQSFARNETFKVWALHVWVWRANPKGVFADWNPKVSCPEGA
ncbi:MAG: hypothetical protein ACT4PJ_14355 [Gemmatimonadaceae bacterium]